MDGQSRSSMHHHSLWIYIELANSNCDASVIKKFEENRYVELFAIVWS